MTEHSQHGLVAIILLVLTSLAGSLILGLHSIRAGQRSQDVAMRQKSELLQAYDALISYTTHYPYLYGARGAGVGHLPCPDTDFGSGLNDHGWSSRSGPNPPCGSYSTVSGRLPTHISYPSHRYLFTSGLNLPVSYKVSDRLINNPANRKVNPSTFLTAQRSAFSLAIFEQSSPHAYKTAEHKSRSMLTPSSMLIASKSAVAAWFVNRVSRLKSLNCLLAADESDSPLGPLDDSLRITDVLNPNVPPDWCGQLRATAQRCQSAAGRFEASWQWYPRLLNHSLSTPEDVEALSQLNILLLTDGIPESYDCDSPPNPQLFIEGAPINSHWFVRNQWSAWIRLLVDGSCKNNSATNCTFLKFAKHYEHDSPLIIHWGEK